MALFKFVKPQAELQGWLYGMGCTICILCRGNTCTCQHPSTGAPTIVRHDKAKGHMGYLQSNCVCTLYIAQSIMVLNLVVQFVTCIRLHLFYLVSKICTFIHKKQDFTIIRLSSLSGITLNIQFQSIELLTSSSGCTNCSMVRAVPHNYTKKRAGPKCSEDLVKAVVDA